MSRYVSPSELLLRKRLRTLGRLLPEARRGDGAALHQARVATRRYISAGVAASGA